MIIWLHQERQNTVWNLHILTLKPLSYFNVFSRAVGLQSSTIFAPIKTFCRNLLNKSKTLKLGQFCLALKILRFCKYMVLTSMFA